MKTNQGRHAVDEDPTAAASHDLLKAILRCERRVRRSQPQKPTKPLEKPKGADAVLARLAACHRPGDVLGIVQVAASGGCSTGAAVGIRRWAMSRGLWPYGLMKAESGRQVDYESMLAAVLAAYAPGSQVGRAHIADATGCTDRLAADVRAWARAQGRWPFVDATPHSKRPGGGP